MNVLVTGVRGKVGAATAKALVRAGHAVTGTDLMRGRLRAARSGGAGVSPSRPHPGRRRVRGHARDERGCPLRRHPRAHPEPGGHRGPNNLMSTFDMSSKPRSASGSRGS